MRGDEDVWKSEQPSEVIVLQDLAGEIFEEDAFFLFVNIERDAAEMAALQRLDKRLGVDERAAADVDDDRAGFGQLDRFAVERCGAFRALTERAA